MNLHKAENDATNFFASKSQNSAYQVCKILSEQAV